MSNSNPDEIRHSETKENTGRIWPDWHEKLAAFRQTDRRTASRQLTNTLIPYCGLWYLMYKSIQRGYPYALSLLIALPAAAFLVRIFILFHDCVHGSLFPSKRANTFFGYLTGVLTFTSFEDWRFTHLRHHVTYANLDARGFGDIWTMTLAEYNDASSTKRLLYRLYRSPLVLIGLGGLFLFLLRNRLPARHVRRQERAGIIFTNLLLIAVVLLASRLIGWQTYLAVQLPLVWIAGAGGIWLFYVQHQFPGGYWARKEEWEPLPAAMEGSSYYKLPAVLRWFSGNIGYHHIHHLNPRIPNYQLKKCYDAIPALQAREPINIAQSLTCVHLKVWDEQQRKMIPFPARPH